MCPDYLPGYGGATTRMLTARTAAERAAFVPSALLAGARVLDVGCGPGSITAGLAERAETVVALDAAAEHLPTAAAALAGSSRRVVVRGSAAALPLPDAAVDVVFSHAVLEHLADPGGALAEMRRVLRPGGTLAVASSDWSGAVVEPGGASGADARRAVAGYRLVRERAAGHPDAGARLAGWVRAAGLAVEHHEGHLRRDMDGGDLAAYLAERLTGDDPVLAGARAAALRWAADPAPAVVRQRWVEVLARRNKSARRTVR